MKESGKMECHDRIDRTERRYKNEMLTEMRRHEEAVRNSQGQGGKS